MDNTGRVPTEPGSREPSPSGSVSAASGFDPSRITEALEAVDGKLLQPIIRKAADEFYCTALEAAEDYLRDNLDNNLKAHLSMLERESQRMWAELWEIDKALGGVPLGHDARVAAIKQQGRDASRYFTLIYNVSKKFDGEDRFDTALRYIRTCDSDGSPKGRDGEDGSTGTVTARAEGIAQ